MQLNNNGKTRRDGTPRYRIFISWYIRHGLQTRWNSITIKNMSSRTCSLGLFGVGGSGLSTKSLFQCESIMVDRTARHFILRVSLDVKTHALLRTFKQFKNINENKKATHI